jgi:thiamine pyrophosphate-dependent acetolactate synthase large subunit-like protein
MSSPGPTAPTPDRSGAESVVDFLERNTAPVAFGLPGSSSVQLFHHLKPSNVTFVPSVQENAAVGMADGYARFKGLTTVLLYMLPGIATGLSNIYNGFRDETPLLMIVSQLTSRARTGLGAVGEADIEHLTAPFTRHSHEVRHRNQLWSALTAAARFADGPPGGPSVTAIPEDVATARAPDDVQVVRASVQASVADDDLGPIIDRLRRAEQPLVIVGGQLRRTGGSDLLEALAEALALPVMYEPFWNDRLGISPAHHSSIGQLTERSSLAASADFVMLLGCRFFNEIQPRSSNWFPNAFVAHVNADPYKVANGRAADWSAVASPARVVGSLWRELDAVGPGAARLDERRARLQDASERRYRRRRTVFDGVAGALADQMERSILVDEGVTANASILSALRSPLADRYVSTAGGSLGWGVPAAAGVALATDLPVTCALGDGAFFFGLAGLVPAVALDLPVTYVVLDNGGFASTQYFEWEYLRSASADEDPAIHALGSDFRGRRPNICEVARGFGLEAHEAENLEDLQQCLRAEAKGPRLIRIELDPRWWSA